MIDNRIYRFIVLLMALCCVSIAGAQSGISVKSFTELTQDLDARVSYPELDQNGRKCALVKVVTTESNFSFDNGLLGVTKVIHKPELSEWWVYLPVKTMKLKIMHPLLGQLKDTDDGFYDFPAPLKEAACYRMELTTGKVIVTVEEERVKTGYLVINSIPEGAHVYLNEGGIENYAGMTPFYKNMPYGTYNYRIKKSLYHDEVGEAVIDQSRVVQDIMLRPAFGSLKVSSNPPGAIVTIQNDSREFTTPCTIEQLASGRHKVSIVAPRYASFSREVEIADGQQAELEATLDARFATVTINTLPGATITVNGQVKGKGNYSEELGEGIYDIEVSLANHRSVTRQIEVMAKQPQTLTLEPTPIYGSLNVESQPMFANVTINGKSYGDTPLSIEKMLIGDYEVVLSKEGCATVTKRVTITENNLSTVKESLHQYGKQIDKTEVLSQSTNRTPMATEKSKVAVSDDNSKARYKGMLDFGYGIAVGDVPQDLIGVSTVHGCEINKYLFVGAGVGANYLYNYSLINLPIFADVRAFLPIKGSKFTPFVDVRAGYSLLDVEGFYFNPSVGLRIGGKRIGASLTVGYEMQLSDLYFNYEGKVYNGSGNVGALKLRIGFEF